MKHLKKYVKKAKKTKKRMITKIIEQTPLVEDVEEKREK